MYLPGKNLPGSGNLGKNLRKNTEVKKSPKPNDLEHLNPNVGKGIKIYTPQENETG